MPKNLDIATWWATERPEVFDIDLASPACFACCGPLILDGDWNTSRLQRCHLTPKSLGGPDTPDNVVLLCADCHQAAPDHVNPRWMIAWIQAREPYIETMYAALQREVVKPLADLGATAADIVRYINDPAFREQARASMQLQSGRLAPSTFAAALAEYHTAQKSPGQGVARRRRVAALNR